MNRHDESAHVLHRTGRNGAGAAHSPGFDAPSVCDPAAEWGDISLDHGEKTGHPEALVVEGRSPSIRRYARRNTGFSLVLVLVLPDISVFRPTETSARRNAKKK